MEKGPDFIIPGFPKCGTTWLYARLKEVDSFEMPTLKELHYFNRSNLYNDGSSGAIFSPLRNKKRLFRGFGKSKIETALNLTLFWQSTHRVYTDLFNVSKGFSGDITPEYIVLREDGIKQMAETLNGVPLIFMLRDPIDRIWSQFRMSLRDSGRSLDTLSKTDIEKELKTVLFQRRSDYKFGILTFKKYFTQSRIGLTFYDQLTRDPKKLLDEIVYFISGKKLKADEFAKIRFQSKDNPSKPADIPHGIYEQLKVELKPQYIWLKQVCPEFGQLWYERHYSQVSNVEKKFPFLKEI